MYLNYRNRGWPLRFRILELICCMAIIVLSILLFVFETVLKFFIVIPVLVFGSTFALICLFSVCGFGAYETQRLFRSWIFFATAGMALFFLAAGLLIIPTLYKFQSIYLTLTITFALLIATIFLLELLFMVKFLHVNIIPEPITKQIDQHPALVKRVSIRNIEVQTGKSLTVCPVCGQTCNKTPEECMLPKQEVIKEEVPKEEIIKKEVPKQEVAKEEIKPVIYCAHCHEKIDPCDEEICTVKVTKSTQLSIREPPIKTESFGKTCQVVSQKSQQSTKESCHLKECKDKRKLEKTVACSTTCGRSIASTKSSEPILIEPEPEPEPVLLIGTCNSNFCKKTVFQLTRAIQVDLDKQSIKSSNSKKSAKVSPMPSEAPKKLSSLEAQIIPHANRSKASGQSQRKVSSQSSKDTGIKSTKEISVQTSIGKKPSIISKKTSTTEIKVCRPSVECTIRGSKKDRVICPLNYDTKVNSPAILSEEIMVKDYERLSQITKVSASTSATSLVERNKSKQSTQAFKYIPKVKTSNKSNQVSNIRECPIPTHKDKDCGCPERTKNVSTEKISKIIQTSDILLPQLPRTPVEGKAAESQTYDAEVSSKHPYIILVKQCESTCPRQPEYAQFYPQSPPDISGGNRRFFQEQSRAVPMQVADVNENRQMGAGPSSQPDADFDNRRMQYNRTSYDDADDDLQYPQGQRREPFKFNNILAHQPYADDPKRNGLDEEDQIVKQASPVFRYISKPAPRVSDTARTKDKSAKSEPLRPQVPKRRMSLPISASQTKKDTKSTKKTMSDPPRK